MNRIAWPVAGLVMLVLATGCDRTRTPPVPKAAEPSVPKAAERASGTSRAPAAGNAVLADAHALLWVADAANAVGGGSLSAAERSFINEAAGAGLYEVEGGQMAALKATQPALRAFGATLVTQHRAAHAELQGVASANGITLPMTVEADKRSKLERLARLNGAAFDREFVQTVGIADHEAVIARFNAASRDTRDPMLRAWIEKTLPALQRHLQEAKQLTVLPPG